MANFERTLLLAIASLENTTAGDIYNVEQGRDGLTVYSTKATKKFPDEIKKYLVKKYQKGNRMILSTRAGSLRVVPDDIYINFVKRTKSTASKSTGGKKVPTAIQEAGSAYVMSRVLTNNSSFKSPASIQSDKITYTQLEKIFGPYKDSLDSWIHSYFEHQKAFFKEFETNEWKTFEHGGEDFMTFIKKQANNVKVKTVSGRFVDLGKYETWNPTDIWAIKNKDQVMKLIDDAIDEKGQTLTELNNVLLNLMSSSNRKLVGLSLKKINQSESANFAYVNKSPKSVEFATVEKIKMSEIDIVIKTEDSVDGMSQGAYIVFDKYRINVIRTPVEGRFSNLKYESKIDGSGGRGGAAPVKLVDDLLKDHSKGHRITFVNKHQEYPQTAEEFYDDSRDYKSMYNSLQKYITGTKSYDEFKSKIMSMFDSDRVKNRLVAQSKLMQLHFFSDAIVKNSNDPEFWTDLLYLSLKVGNRFAPHGKLA
tara:strand:+ start:69 stop:1505 length:1437 start_codon:yes stop_codon:yes gene_type:complete